MDHVVCQFVVHVNEQYVQNALETAHFVAILDVNNVKNGKQHRRIEMLIARSVEAPIFVRIVCWTVHFVVAISVLNVCAKMNGIHKIMEQNYGLLRG